MIYEYYILDDDGQRTGEIYEHSKGMNDPDPTTHPETGKKLERIYSTPALIKTKGYNTLGMIASKNTEEKIKRGEIEDPKTQAEKARPWWRKNREKRLNTRGWSDKDAAKYIFEGKEK